MHGTVGIVIAASLGLAITPASGQVTDLSVVEDGQDAVLTWGTGASPYRVYRSASPDFFFGNRIVAQGLAVQTATDPNALQPGSHSHYYAVFVNGQPDPPGFITNPPPPGAPVISGISPGSGQPGDTVVISGSGFLGDGSRMIVTFHHAVAEILAATETSLQVVVPEGAKTGSVVVCIASDICSNPFPFSVTYGPAFLDISSIAFETGTGSLWVADRSTADDLLEIEADGTIQMRPATLNEPLVGHPTPADGTGRVYYCNSSPTVPNAGQMRYINSVTNTDNFFGFAGTGGTDNVRCEGIAANVLEPSFAYLLNGVNNTIRRVFQGGNHDPMYGDQPFPFNSPAGARFDSSGDLYVSATTSIYRILFQEAGVELVATGFTAAAGMDLVELGDDTILAVADESTGKVWLVNAATGSRIEVASGLSGPVGVAFGEDPNTGATALYVAEPTRILVLPDPRLEFMVETDQKVLLSRSWGFDPFPSPDQTANGSIAVRVRLTPLLDPTGKTAYFRLRDPRDPSRYIVGATEDDNLPSPPAGSVSTQAAFDANGIAVATLTVNNQYSGNNYQVEAGLASGAAFRAFATSPVFTTWRRGYIEHDFMWKEGSWINADSGAGQPNPMRIFADPTGFTVGADVQVLSGETFDTAIGEFGEVAAVGPNYVDVDTDPGPGQSGLVHLYPGNPDDEAPFSFIALVGPGFFGAAPNTARLAIAFDDAFAEWVALPTSDFVPSFPVVPDNPDASPYLSERTRRFFNALRNPSPPPILNTIHVVSAAGALGTPPPLGLSITQSDPDSINNLSWVFDTNIGAAFPPGDVDAVRESTTGHEIAHQFNVNSAGPQEHDAEDAWTPAGWLCLMNISRDRTLGISKFHAPAGASTQDLMCIRTHIDDLDSSIFCSQP